VWLLGSCQITAVAGDILFFSLLQFTRPCTMLHITYAVPNLYVHRPCDFRTLNTVVGLLHCVFSKQPALWGKCAVLTSVTESVHGVNASSVFLLFPHTITLWNQDLKDTNRHVRSEVTYDKWVWSATGAEVVAFTFVWLHMQQLAAAMQSSVYCH